MADEISAGIQLGPRIFGTTSAMTVDEHLNSFNDATELASRTSFFDQEFLKSYIVGGRLHRQWLLAAANKSGKIAFLESDGDQLYNLSAILDGYFHFAHGGALPIFEDMKSVIEKAGVSFSYQFGTLRGEGAPSALWYFLDTELTDEVKARLLATMPRQYLLAYNWRRVKLVEDNNVFFDYAKALSPLIENGALIALGDHGAFFGLGMVWEVMALASGAGNERALQAATINGAKSVGLDQYIGSLEVGKLADLVVLDHDPLTDVRTLMSPSMVMANGRLIDANSLVDLVP